MLTGITEDRHDIFAGAEAFCHLPGSKDVSSGQAGLSKLTPFMA